MNDTEIIDLLGGVSKVAKMLDIKPPSVSGWLKEGIPEGRLRDLAAQIEIRSGGRFSRKARWPENYAFYWPELASLPEPAPAPPPPEPPATELAALPTRQEQPGITALADRRLQIGA